VSDDIKTEATEYAGYGLD